MLSEHRVALGNYTLLPCFMMAANDTVTVLDTYGVKVWPNFPILKPDIKAHQPS